MQVASAFLLLGALILIFIFSVRNISKYLFKDSVYPLFTSPNSGTSIMVSRNITGLIQIFIVALVSFSMFYLNAPYERPSYLFVNFNVGPIVYNTVTYIWAILYSLTLIYFCMIVG